MKTTRKIGDNAFFSVTLDGVKLTEEQASNIEKGINKVVMNEIAQIDNRGDLMINRRLDLNPRFKGFNIPIIWGIWIEDFDIFKKRMMETWK